MVWIRTLGLDEPTLLRLYHLSRARDVLPHIWARGILEAGVHGLEEGDAGGVTRASR